MALSYATNVYGSLYASYVGNDANYESPGNFGLPESVSGNVGVVSTTITAAGTYTAVPTANASAGGATFQTEMALVSGSALATAGTVYAPGDTITLVGGTFSTAAKLTVATAKLISATLVAGGTGYANSATFNVTVAGGTSSSAAIISVTTNSSGVITTINSVGTAGSYTVLPTLAANAPTGGSGTGLTVNLVFGVLAYTITQAGVYTALPSNPISTTTSGSGTGFTLTGSWGVTALVITNAGEYEIGSSAPTISFSTGAATATATLGTSTSGVDEQKLMTLVEIMRAFINEADSVQQLRDMHDVIRKMFAFVKFGGSASASTGAVNFDPSEMATNARAAAMNYIAKSPKRLGQNVSGTFDKGMTL